MIEFLTRYAAAAGWHWRLDETGNLYVTSGESETYPCVCAHVDTVHSIEPGGITPVEIDGLVTGINPLTMVQTGIGGDDKCGIYAALTCLRSLPVCKAAFFVDEEIGCAGSGDADMAFFADCRFVLQADRKGRKDFVHDINGRLSSKTFMRAVKPILATYGFRPCSGMTTDIEALRNNEIGISVANMSAGYYNPHSRGEYICIADLENTRNLMVQICQEMVDVYPFVFERRAVTSFSHIMPASWLNGEKPVPPDDWGDYADGGKRFPDYSPHGAHVAAEEVWIAEQESELESAADRWHYREEYVKRNGHY